MQAAMADQDRWVGCSSSRAARCDEDAGDDLALTHVHGLHIDAAINRLSIPVLDVVTPE